MSDPPTTAEVLMFRQAFHTFTGRPPEAVGTLRGITLQALLSRVRVLEANQRTPGTIEVCDFRHCGFKHKHDWHKCKFTKCPLALASTALGESK